ncbi:MAG: hypothetical protein RIT02_1794 [Planctomycetota bacterium]|jgi:uncharacterized repeat protein (TIGR04138 family)
MESLSSTSSSTYHPAAFRFVYAALRYTQQQLGRNSGSEKTGHISGSELLDGIRLLGLQTFGMLCPLVFARWGVHTTDDFGHIVFQMIDSGDMRRTRDDCLEDFFGVYSFHQVFVDDYVPDVSGIFN